MSVEELEVSEVEEETEEETAVEEEDASQIPETLPEPTIDDEEEETILGESLSDIDAPPHLRRSRRRISTR